MVVINDDPKLTSFKLWSNVIQRPLLLNLKPMRITMNRKAFAEWVEKRLYDDKWFTLEFCKILNSFEQWKIQYIPRLPLSRMLLVTGIVAKINLYPVKAISFEDAMKYIVTGEWENIDNLPESVQKALPTVYVPRKATTVPESI